MAARYGELQGFTKKMPVIRKTYERYVGFAHIFTQLGCVTFEDYDSNFEKHILKRGDRFKMLEEDEDEVKCWAMYFFCSLYTDCN